MGSSRLKSVLLALGAVFGCLLSTSANQESRGTSWKPCDSGPMKSEPDVTRPTEVVRLSVAEADTMMRVRRSLEGGEGGPGSQRRPSWFTTGENIGGVVDRRPYSRTGRNFMRFGRSQSTGSEDVVCLPVAAAAADEEPEVTSAEVDDKFSSKDVDERRFSRFGRDQGQYDYNGKPFMRFGKRRFGRSPEFTGSRDGDVVCFRATGDAAREKGKRFMRFGRAFTIDPRYNGQMEDRATDAEEEKNVVRFGKSSYPVGTGSVADYEKQDDQSKI